MAMSQENAESCGGALEHFMRPTSPDGTTSIPSQLVSPHDERQVGSALEDLDRWPQR